MPSDIWIVLAIGFSGTVFGAFATVVVALINRQPVLAAALDERIAILIETYERTIGELRKEIARLEDKIDVYEDTIGDLRDHIDKLEAKIDMLNVKLKEAEHGAPCEN